MPFQTGHVKPSDTTLNVFSRMWTVYNSWHEIINAIPLYNIKQSMALSTRKGFGVELVFTGVKRDFKNSAELYLTKGWSSYI